MTQLTVDANSDLSGAIRSAHTTTEDDLFLVLRNQDGKVLWSGDIHQWSTDGRDTTITTRPVTERIEWAVQAARLKAEFELRENGLL